MVLTAGCGGGPNVLSGNAPTAPSAQNAPPTVTVTFDGANACVPTPAAACTLAVVAQATDPDGDPLRYAWSGCASGTSGRATCTVDRIGSVVARVEVSDDHGHRVTGEASGEGREDPNRPPIVSVRFEDGATCTPQLTHACTLLVAADATDPEVIVVSCRYCGFLRSIATTSAPPIAV